MGGHRNIPVVGGRRDRVDGGRGGMVEGTCENTNHSITMWRIFTITCTAFGSLKGYNQWSVVLQHGVEHRLVRL